MSENPYAAPSTLDPLLESQNPTSEYTRRLNLKHEASIKSIGTLYFFSAFILGGAMILSFSLSAERASFSFPIALLFLGLAVFQFFVAIGLRKLKSWARIPAIIFSCLGLFGFPIGTLICAYFLYLLCSRKGSMIFSEKYAQVIADTPEIKYRTSTLSWIILTIFVILIIGAIVYAGRS